MIPPLYVESSSGRGRIVSPFVRMQTFSDNYSHLPEAQRRGVLYETADQFALLKSKGIFMTDMHLGNLAKETGGWFGNSQERYLFPDITIAGSSVKTIGGHNVINPLALLVAPVPFFAWKARRRQHRLIQGAGDFFYFVKSYRERLEHYKKAQ